MKTKFPVLLFIVALLVTGCATPPEQAALSPEEHHSVQSLLRSAEQTRDTTVSQDYRLEAARRLQAQARYEQSQDVLDGLSGEALSQERESEYLRLAIHNTYTLEDRERAERLAGELDPGLAGRLPETHQARTVLEHARVMELADEPWKAARVLIQGFSFIDRDKHQESVDRIWNHLRQTPEETLEQASQRATDTGEQGWLELALSMRATRGDTLEAQSGTIQRWVENWRRHPAATNLPRELALLAELPEKRPEHLALALPLSGSMAGPGRAIREGFMAAYYADLPSNGHNMTISVHDTHEQNFDAIYAELLETDPDLVIGPLRREEVENLTDQNRLPIPVLALNYLDERTNAPIGLYQFGLSSEDEVEQVAERLAVEGHRNALLFAPAGDWGNRMLNAFRNAHETNEANFASSVRYDSGEDLKRVVADGFAIDESRRRANQLMRLTGTSMQFEPRRRQDIDAIVLLATPSDARQFKPLFSFYYGGNLPVYGTSLIYAGNPDPSRDGDLEGIHFTDIPWTLEPEENLRPLLNQLFPQLGSRYDRLFALGVDSYQLTGRLPLLEEVEQTWITGKTGILRMDENRAMEREQLWARFESGRPVQTPVIREPREDEATLPEVIGDR